MKLTLSSNGGKHRACIDGVDISSKATRVRIDIDPVSLPEIIVDLCVTEQQIEHENADIFFITIDGKKFKLTEVE